RQPLWVVGHPAYRLGARRFDHTGLDPAVELGGQGGATQPPAPVRYGQFPFRFGGTGDDRRTQWLLDRPLPVQRPGQRQLVDEGRGRLEAGRDRAGRGRRWTTRDRAGRGRCRVERVVRWVERIVGWVE